MTTRAFEGTWRRAPLKSILRPFSGGAGTLIKGDATKEWEEGLYPGFSASGQDIWLDAPQFSGDGLVLSAVGARCGRVFRAAGRWGIVANTVALLPQDSADIRFLWYLTNREGFWERGGTAQPYVRVPETLSRRLLIPRSEDQVLIADFLDRETERIDAVVAAKRRMIELLEEERTALITHTVTKGLDPTAPMKDSGIPWLGEIPAHWLVTRLKFHIDSLAGYAFASEGFVGAEAGTVRLLRGVNVGVDRVDWTDVVHWDENALKGLERYALAEGDLVLGLDRPWIKAGIRVAEINLGDLPARLLQRVLRLRAQDNLTVDFLKMLLASASFLAYFEPVMTGISVPHISESQVGDFQFALPPLEEQVRLSQDVAERQYSSVITRQHLTTQLTLLDEYRQALITAAVTGQLDEATLRGEKPIEETMEVPA